MPKQMMARRAGRCDACGKPFDAGAWISWDRASRTVACARRVDDPSEPGYGSIQTLCAHPDAEPMTREEYAARREAKLDRALGYAQNAQRRSDGAFATVHRIADMIPLGQPILVGHHSERHARRDQERIHNGMQRGIEEQQKAAYWRGRAHSIESDTSIRSYDPDAAEKLRAKIAELETQRERMKAINAILRKGTVADAHAALTLTEREVADLQSIARHQPYHATKYAAGTCYPPYALTNLGGNLRRYRERLAQIDG
jgi:hypothetical protein